MLSTVDVNAFLVFTEMALLSRISIRNHLEVEIYATVFNMEFRINF